MKKTLLMLVAFMATMTAFAQDEQEGWMKSFAPVADASDLAGIHTAVAGDGSVYVSSTYNKAFTFADKTVTDPEGLLSSCVLKYDKDGNELWSVTLFGNCEIYAMTADTDGTLYVAGKSSDVEVVCTGTSGESKTIVNPASDPWDIGMLTPTANSCFILKISPEGVISVAETMTPEVNAEIHAIMGDPYGTGEEINIYDSSYNDPMYVTPLSIKLEGDKVYVAAQYVGDVTKIGWKGAYLNYFDMMIFDMRSLGVFSLNKSDLTNAANVAYVQVTGTVVSGFAQQYPEAIDFVVDNGIPYVAFIGFGNQTITTSDNSKGFEFETTSDESGNKEHAMVLVNTKELDKAKVFHAAMHDKDAIPYNLVGAAIADGNCILGGTFYGNFPLDNTVTKEFNTSFVASIKMADCSVNWATPNTAESYATCMIVAGAEIHASTTVGTYTIKTDKGTIDEEETMAQVFDDCAVYNDTYCSTIFTEGANVVVYSPHMNPSGIEAVKAAVAKGETKIYNLNGQRVAAPQKGLYIVNGVKVAIK